MALGVGIGIVSGVPSYGVLPVFKFDVQDSCKGCMHKVRACAKAVTDLYHGNASRHVTIAQGRNIIRDSHVGGYYA